MSKIKRSGCKWVIIVGHHWSSYGHYYRTCCYECDNSKRSVQEVPCFTSVCERSSTRLAIINQGRFEGNCNRFSRRDSIFPSLQRYLLSSLFPTLIISSRPPIPLSRCKNSQLEWARNLTNPKGSFQRGAGTRNQGDRKSQSRRSPAEAGVASLRPWQIAIYEQWASIVKNRHVTRPRFLLLSRSSPSLPQCILSPFSEVLFSPLSPPAFLLGVSISRDIPLQSISPRLFANNFAKWKSRDCRGTEVKSPGMDSTGRNVFPWAEGSVTLEWADSKGLQVRGNSAQLWFPAKGREKHGKGTFWSVLRYKRNCCVFEGFRRSLNIFEGLWVFESRSIECSLIPRLID